MLKKEEFKKFRKWTEEEIEFIKQNRFNFKHRQNAYKHLSEMLQKKGFKRTKQAVARECQKLGLVNYNTKDETIRTKCKDCKKEIKVRKRYFERDKEHRCQEHQKIRNRSWDTAQENQERNKMYHKIYLKKWRQINKNDKTTTTTTRRRRRRKKDTFNSRI